MLVLSDVVGQPVVRMEGGGALRTVLDFDVEDQSRVRLRRT